MAKELGFCFGEDIVTAQVLPLQEVEMVLTTDEKATVHAARRQIIRLFVSEVRILKYV